MMYLYQKFKYKTTIVKDIEDIAYMVEAFQRDKVSLGAYDTETTGLDLMKAMPFLYVWGWKYELFACDLRKDIAPLFLETTYMLQEDLDRLFAHNAQYDYHMMINYGMPIPEGIQLADSTTVFRQTSYVDSMKQKSLDAIGIEHVDESAKFAGKVIKDKIKTFNKERRRELMNLYNKEYKKKEHPAFTKAFNAYKKERIKYIEHEWEDIFKWMDEHYQEANYLDVHINHESLMISYAFDDIVIVLEYLEVALPTLMVIDEGLEVFNRECDLIRVVGDVERVGLKLDVDYVIDSRNKVIEFRDELYKELHILMGEEITVGQHKVIIELFWKNWRVMLDKANDDALKAVSGNKEAQRAVQLIRKLRTVDKWLSTYIEGMLNRSVNGRIHTSIDNSGTVSGRVTSNLQQQPNGSLTTALGDTKEEKDNAKVLFTPRRAFIPDEDYELIAFDYSQQELRVQAYYTLVTSDGDLNLLRSYMPFKCTSKITGKEFDYKDPEILEKWDSGEWVLNEDKETVWTPTDVHEATTLNAFPFLVDSSHPDFEYYRGFGKMANFLKNYGGGANALMSQLDVTEEVARQLDQAYYKAFPKIRVYQDHLSKEAYKKGYVENLYGRRYYMENPRFHYKLSNYMVQGSCADMVKTVELQLAEATKGMKSKFVLPVHDEVIFLVHEDEREELIEIVTGIMNHIPEVPYVPMRVGVEGSKKSWADMEEII